MIYRGKILKIQLYDQKKNEIDITQYITGKTTVLIPIHSYLAL